MFDPTVDARMVDRTPGQDPVVSSAVNFYLGVTHDEVEAYYEAIRDPNDDTPVWYGLNSRLAKIDGEVVEQVWHVGGLYSEAIEEIVVWLERAVGVAENDAQRDALEKLVAYYRSGDLEDWDAYNVAWVNDTDSIVDVINGFVEVYNDPIGYRGSFESVVQFVDPIATERIQSLAREAQWFEDNAPIPDEYKKSDVVGITARAINVVGEAGDVSPATPIGINLPNTDWIRSTHGSKSVTLANIVAAYDSSGRWCHARVRVGRGGDRAFRAVRPDRFGVGRRYARSAWPCVGPARPRRRYAERDARRLHVAARGGPRGPIWSLLHARSEARRARAVTPSVEAGYTEYDHYIRNGIMQQLNRIELGADVEEAHMRNRKLVATWAYELGLEDNVIEHRVRDGKNYYVVNDYQRLRQIFGQQLRELQRIKSEGDFEAIRDLIETHAVKIDPELHAEVKERYAALDIPPYSGFINPRLVPVEENGEIVDVRVEYPDDFMTQMLEYAERYSNLPTWNF